MRDEQPNTVVFAAVGVITIACALLGALGLRQIASPPEVADRLANLTDQVGQFERASKTRSAPAAFRRDALCRTGDQAEIETILQRIGQVANGTGVSVTALTLTPAEPASARLVLLQLKLEASGPYDRMLLVLSGLSTATPQLFVDRLDLRQAGAGVNLSLSSKVFCWNDAQS